MTLEGLAMCLNVESRIAVTAVFFLLLIFKIFFHSTAFNLKLIIVLFAFGEFAFKECNEFMTNRTKECMIKPTKTSERIG